MTSNGPTIHTNQEDLGSEDRLELYVLDMLPNDECDQIEALLRDDTQARDRVRELRGIASSLAFDLEPLEPSEGLRSRILDAARADVQDPTADLAPAVAPISLAERREERSTRQAGSISRFTPWAVAAMLALALVGSLAWNLDLRGQLDDRVVTEAYAVVAVGSAEGAGGEVLVVGNQNSALVALSDLPALEPGQVYQVWLIADGDPVPNVTFQPNTAGAASVAVPGDVESYRVLAITVEPEGGSPAPTTQPVISSTLTD